MTLRGPLCAALCLQALNWTVIIAWNSKTCCGSSAASPEGISLGSETNVSRNDFGQVWSRPVRSINVKPFAVTVDASISGGNAFKLLKCVASAQREIGGAASSSLCSCKSVCLCNSVLLPPWGKWWKNGLAKCFGTCTVPRDVWVRTNATYEGVVDWACIVLLHKLRSCRATKRVIGYLNERINTRQPREPTWCTI